MKPKKLMIRGLNSFVEKQVIDFSNLTEKGFFGIFGPTGSGKSTILDAITIALYGKVNRDSRGFINTETKELEVSYEFQIGVGNHRKDYICDRSMKIDKKGRYKTTLARVSEVGVENTNVLAEGASNVRTEIEKIVGLSAEDFTRSVVLPQGKFSEFLRLTGLERRSMLERIFKLERYGKVLRERIKKGKGKNEKLLLGIKGELNRYNGISKEEYDKLKKELNVLEKEENMLKEKKLKYDELYEKYRSVWELQNELKIYENKYEVLNKKSEEMNDNTEKLKLAKNALNVKPFIDNVNETMEKIKSNDKELKVTVEALSRINVEQDKIQKEYESAAKKQKEKIPKLIRMESDLNRAIDIKKKICDTQKERNKLALEYKKTASVVSKLKGEVNDIKEKKESLDEVHKKLEKRINEISVSPKYRENIQNAYEKFCKVKELEITERELKQKKEKYLNVSQQVNRTLQIIIEKRQHKTNTLEQLINQKKELDKKFPGNNEILLKKQEKLNKVKDEYDKLVESNEKKIKLQTYYNDIISNKKEYESKLKEYTEKYEKVKQEIENVKNELEEIKNENLASILSENLKEGMPCPVCGSTHHIKLPNRIDKKEIEEKHIIKEKLQKEIDEINKIIQSYNIKIAEVKKDEDHVNKEIKDVLNILEDQDLIKCKDKKNELQIEFEKLKIEIDNWNTDIEKLEKELLKTRDDKSDIDKKYAALTEKIKNVEENLLNINNDLDKINSQHAAIYNKYDKLINILSIDDIEKEANKLKKYDEELVELKDKDKEIRLNLDKFNVQKEKIQTELLKYESEKSKIEQSGKEKKQYINEYKEEINKICDKNEPEDLLVKVKDDIEHINKLENDLKIMLDNKMKEKDNEEKNKVSLEKKKSTLGSLCCEQKDKLLKVMKENNFEDERHILKYIMTKQQIKELEDLIKDYEDKFKEVKSNIKRIRGRLNNETIDEEQWNSIVETRKQNEEVLKKKLEIKVHKQKELVDMKNDLNQVEELTKVKLELEHKVSLFEHLDSLVKGNKFVEFVATSQLKYIAVEASKRLKSITKGRYALEINDDGNFVMRDDFNGGTRRSTSTLSGGETFLTSLSLALALSSQIQLKGSAPLEFFFLDEGFGSLDSDLLDIVMTSLENLRSEKLCVGIISHVEELRNRVPVKVIVTPAIPGEGGSKVKIEYS
ncbi:SbcC/MukB-like Walker B domain-containing protein [Haloimpatiens sp. FM7330]|uniref:SbcC/MukB-like Walker B domain-containing protein n=1 Tax=Haloimpatiens sp. FM7330 TaxID=3298610 RepID=UPI003629638C